MSAWKKITEIEIGSGGTQSISFLSVGNIPNTYTDLLLVCSLRSNNAANNDDFAVSFNGSTSNRSWRVLQGNGSSRLGAIGSTGRFINGNGNNATSGVFSSHSIYIPDYAGNRTKSLLVDSVTENNATQAYQEILSGLWDDTSPITNITITPIYGTSILQYSSATLYGITKGSSGGVTVS